ncbi:MAG: NAD(P)H-dependent oxidoreductase [Pseudomonadota bacterium]
MAGKRILLIQGHPDASAVHLGHALADAYAKGAAAAGHEVRRVEVARLDFPLLRSQHEWEHSPVPAALEGAQADIAWAEHLVIFFPLWLGDMPAVLKAFLEQVARPGFAFKGEGRNPFAHKGLTGRSARVVVTMGMPALVYRWYFRAHSLKSLERNILGFVGIAPIHETLIGMVGQGEGAVDANARRPKPFKAGQWLAKLQALGAAGD